MFYEDSRMGMAKAATPNPYNNHGLGCTCSICGQTRGLAKRDAGASEEKMHLAIAHGLHHSQMRDEHQRKAYGWGGVQDGQTAPELTVEQKAKHLEAAAAHRQAHEHYREAANSYRDNLPKGAAEHQKLAEEAAARAEKLSAKANG
jgi:hypothetical protein